jgi:hypothetical protein
MRKVGKIKGTVVWTTVGFFLWHNNENGNEMTVGETKDFVKR